MVSGKTKSTLKMALLVGLSLKDQSSGPAIKILSLVPAGIDDWFNDMKVKRRSVTRY